MAEKEIIQDILDVIDERITGKITLGRLASEFGYSTSHLGRMFSVVTGVTLMSYITRRKLRYALYDLACGERIIDVAVKYGFETHAGFTRAFRKHFGYPPSIYRIHAVIQKPVRVIAGNLINSISGTDIIYPEIMIIPSFTVVGFTSRHALPDIRSTHDVPFYIETIDMNYWDPLTRLHDLFSRSHHCEYTVCFDVDSGNGEFTYLLGVGVDNPGDHAKIEADMYEMSMPGGLYAKFTTPLVTENEYGQAIRDAWETAFDRWLPSSRYIYDETRYDFEFYDERDHYYKGKDLGQMDIYIPVRKL